MSKQDIKQVNVPIASLRREPNNDSELETQCLFGEEIRIFSQKNNLSKQRGKTGAVKELAHIIFNSIKRLS